MNIGFTKTFTAGAAVTKRRLVAFDGAGAVIQGAAAANNLIGVADAAGDVASGSRIDVIMSGQPEVEAGAAIVAGAPVTTDATGRAITAVATNVAIGFAVEGADAAGDIITIQLGRYVV